MDPETMDPFTLKIRELLGEVRLDLATIKVIDQATASISNTIQGIPEQKVGPDAVPGFIRDIGAPPGKLNFMFVPPTTVTVAGSHSIGCVTKPLIHVDLLVRMPKDCFHEKDYLNHIYHAKRCLYLHVIAEHLKQTSLVRKVELSTFRNEARKPVLHIFPDVESVKLSNFFIRVIPTATSLFQISRLSLSRNNVRAVIKGGIAVATPKYNNSILEDMFLEETAEFLKKMFMGCNNLVEALALLKVWVRQRSTINSHDCLNGFLLSVILSYLASEVGENQINQDMDAWQIFCLTMNFIASSEIFDKGLLFHLPGPSNLSDEGIKHYCQAFDVVLFDPSCHTNLLSRMTYASLAELRDEATRAHRCAMNRKDGGFEELFMTKVDFPSKFDYFIRINLAEKCKLLEKDFGLDDECWNLFQGKIQTCLERALTDRVSLLRVTWENTPSGWDIKNGFSKFFHEPLLVGILVSSCEKSFRMVDIGPSGDKEVSNFRNFWGDKAELRRFKDGKIAESVVWNCELWERHLIVKRITEYVLLKHFQLSSNHAVHAADQLDFCLLHGSRDPISISGGLITAFEALSKRLRLMDDIPLKVSSVQPLDPAFRYTSVFPPEPNPAAHEKVVSGKSSVKLVSSCIQPLEIMIQLEGSGNWPLDEVAVEKTKTAFLLKIGQSLQERWGIMCTATQSEVDVLMLGYAFRLQIMHETTFSLLTNPVENNKTRGLSHFDKELFFRSQHSSMINGLNGLYPMYGPVVRLAKRWITTHLFSSFIAMEAIELLVAYIFLKPFPFNPPCSRITGFLRFLQLLANHDWTFSPLIVDINGSFTLKDEQEIDEYFNLSRKSYEDRTKSIKPVMFLATSYDKSSHAWTKASPKIEVLKRIMAYAKSSADLLSYLILHGANGAHTWECLFKTPLNNYDAVVLLHPYKLSFPLRLLFTSEIEGKLVIQGSPCKDFQPYLQLDNAQQQLKEVRDSLMVGFDPIVCFVEDLQEQFQDVFKVWYDSLGGDAIGLTWVSRGHKKRSRESEDINQEAVDVLKNVGEVGKGLVRSVYLLKPPRI